MAGNKENPRQKMIGMMYLVLTALLALNISKDVLEAFVNVNESLADTNGGVARRSEVLYADFDLAKSIDPTKVGPYWDKAQIARSQTMALMGFIDSLRTELIAAAEGVEKGQADTLGLRFVSKKDDYDTPTRLMVGDGGEQATGGAHLLKKRLLAYEELMHGLLPDGNRQQLHTHFDLADRQANDETNTWETNMFYHTPLAATVTILSKIRTDVGNLENEVVGLLFRSFSRKDFHFDTVAATVLPRSSYVILGEPYQADIILAAYSKTKMPDIRLGRLDANGRTLLSESQRLTGVDGVGKYQVATSKEGIFTYEGLVELKDAEGTVKGYPFRSEYIVARPSLVVSPTAMNQLYKGVDNPLDISVPGIPAERIKAVITGGNTLRKTGSDSYLAVIAPSSPAQVQVQVSVTMPDGSVRQMGQVQFRVSRLPQPLVSLGGQMGTLRMTATNLGAQLGLSARYDPSFAFNLTCTVQKFRCVIQEPNGNILFNEEVSGNMFNSELQARFRKLKKGSRVFLEDITAVGSDKVVHNPNAITVQVQ